MHRLQTTNEVIDTLGGIKAVAEITGRKYGAVSMWRGDDKTFPANTYLVLTKELRAVGKEAPAALWGMVEPAESAA